MEELVQTASESVQPGQGVGMPEAAPTQQWGNAPQTDQAPQDAAPSEPEYQFDLPSGSRYRTTEDLVRGATEKDFTIERLKAQIAAAQSQRPARPEAPQIDPKQAQENAIGQLQRELIDEYRSDPLFRGESEEAIAAEARIQARVIYRNQQFLRGELQQKEQQQQQAAQEQQWRSFVDSTPELNSPIGREVYERARAQGFTFPNPQAHLDATHAEMYRRGISSGQPMPQAGGTTGVQGAMQTQQRPIFGYQNGSGGPQGQGQGQLPARVQEAVRIAMEKGFTSPESIERIKNTAMENEMRFNKR